MASFDEAPPGNADTGAKIFKTKCAQCHTVDKGAGHKQGMMKLIFVDMLMDSFNLFSHVLDLIYCALHVC